MRTTLPPSLSSLRDLNTTPNPPSATDRQEKSSKGSHRSASPVKNLAGLRRLEKPVHFNSFDDDAGTRQLPSDVRQQYCSIYNAVEYKTGIYPAEIRAKIEAINHAQSPPPWVFRQPGVPQQQDGGDEQYLDGYPVLMFHRVAAKDATVEASTALAELTRVCRIRDVARECLTLR